MRRYARITGTGSYLPPRRLTNHDLAAELAQRGIETSDEWIVERVDKAAAHSLHVKGRAAIGAKLGGGFRSLQPHP